jgi:type I restriction enzyme M protein
MTSTNQRAELQAKIWRIANDVRGSVDGWDFKHFVLGTLFYRFISENFATYIEGGDESIDYSKLSDDVITPEIKEDAIKTKGYFIYPSQLFVNVAKTANTNTDLNTDLKSIFDAIEGCANGYPSEPDIKGLFADFDTTSSRLGNTVESKNDRLAKVLKGIDELTFGNFEDNQIDLFGDAYEFLISNYAANAGKSGGEFFTPQTISKLIAQLAMHGQTSVNKIYDPAAGSGSLLLQAKKHFDNHIIEEGFFGQEINHTTYNLARMNMFLHNVNYDKFNIVLGDTLLNPQLGDDKPFDAIVSNPPYSIQWIGNDDPTLINDDRFAPAGVLAPKSKADFAFVLHALSYLSSKGRAAIVCFPGIFYRGGAEQKIRKYLVDNNYVETVISVAPNLFFGTSIAVNILVLSKSKTNNTTQFIDASGEDFFKKATNTNVLTDKHIDKIMKLFDRKEDVDHIAVSVDNDKIAENDYNLSVTSYVEAEDTREVIDIVELNAEISKTVEKIDKLRADIDEIVKEIGA